MHIPIQQVQNRAEPDIYLSKKIADFSPASSWFRTGAHPLSKVTY